MENIDIRVPLGTVAAPRGRRAPNGIRPLPLIGWTTVVALALYFVAKNALHYYYGSTAHENYAASVAWVRLHIAAGIGALFAGLAQFRTGLGGRRWPLHRIVGRVYLASIAVASVAAAILLTRTTGGWVFASGLAALTIAWTTTSALAWIAIRRGNVTQHREWMIRSYVVTFSFVNFRILNDVLASLHVGRWQERVGMSGWFCWAVPLLITELVMQGRKVFAVGRSTQRAREGP